LEAFDLEIFGFFSPWNSPLSEERKIFRIKLDRPKVCIHDGFMNSKAYSTLSLYTFGYRRTVVSELSLKLATTLEGMLVARVSKSLQLGQSASSALHLQRRRIPQRLP
jgi:hypothetical protein